MLAAVMQPTFLPWIGYFDLIDQVDVFVLLDTVQFEKQSWQQRNRVRSASGLEWITVPVFITGRFGQPIRDVEIKPGSFPGKHIKTLKQHYSGCDYFSDYAQPLEEILATARAHRSLARLNIDLIAWMASALGIGTRFVTASELEASGSRSERLVSILRQLNAEGYVSPRGSLDYLMEDRQTFLDARMPVTLQTYSHPEYRQRYRPFQAGASAVDLLFNEGPAAGSIMRSGRGRPEPIDDVIAKEIGS